MASSNTRVLVLDAGSPHANNLIRSLKFGEPSWLIAGCNRSPFTLGKSAADRNYLVPIWPAMSIEALRRIVETESIDVVIPTTDADVQALSTMRNELGCRTFLPRHETIDFCTDKYAVSRRLRRCGVAAPLTYPIPSIEKVDAIFRKLNRNGKQLWCRIRNGSGSYAAIPVRAPQQARSWIAYWEEMRGVPQGSFTLSEYLPGRDFCVQCLWDKGRLVLAKMAERITYFNTGSPSGVSSMPTLARTVFEPRLLDCCSRAIHAIDAEASGVYFVDLKENERGEACVTEINAGRFATMTNIHDLAGKHNMAVLYVRLALGGRVRIRGARDFAEGYYLVRSIDTLPALVRGPELFAGLLNAG
jgi:carbamoyl-phosphate synthase large subunit